MPITLKSLTVLVLLLADAPVYAASGSEGQWELVKAGDNGVAVYYRTLPSGNVEFKGVSTVESSLSALVAVFLDLESMPKWLYRTRKATLLKRIKANEIYVHMIHTMPFPLAKRDSVNHIQLTQEHETKTVNISVTNAPDYIKPSKDYVRVQVAVSNWQLEPAGNGRVKITFTGYGEPGGSISSETFRSPLFQWLVKRFLWEVPFKTLLKLRQYMGEEKYQNRRFEFIEELKE